MNNDNKNANSGRKYGTAYLTFTNLKGSAYKKGNLIVEGTLEKESKNSPLCKLASFTDMIVEDCALNESKTGTNISVCVNAVGEDNMKRLYEWLKKYTNEDMISEIAPGLLESLGLANNNDDEQVNEDSVASRFSKYRKLYEADDEEEPDKDKGKDEDDKDTESEDENSDSAGESKKEEDGDVPEDGEDEEEELTAVIIEVKKGDEDAAKQEMIDAGVDEDDIEILESEKDNDEGDDADEDNAEDESKDDDKDADDDSSDETVKIKVSIDSFDALKEYLEGKGFDLEEELGGEIVTDDEDDEDDEDDGKEKDEMEDTFDGFDDLFGDDDTGDDDKK